MAATDMSSALASLLQVPGLQEMLNNVVTEQRQQAPLRAGVKQMAAGMMPSYAFGSGGVRPDINAIPRADFKTPPPPGNDLMSKLLPYLLAGAGGASAASKLLGGANGGQSGGNLSPLAQAIKKLFGGGGVFDRGGNFTGQPGSVNGSPLSNNPGEGVGTDFSAMDFMPAGPQWGGPSDPSGGSGVGPGMQSFYESGGGAPGGSSGDDGDWGY